jgi:hypothetical protein
METFGQSNRFPNLIHPDYKSVLLPLEPLSSIEKLISLLSIIVLRFFFKWLDSPLGA